MSTDKPSRRLPIGAEPQASGGTHFRVWAPKRRKVQVVLMARDSHQERAAIPLNSEANGYFSRLVSDAVVGDRYGYRLDDDDQRYPDPASRFQPHGPHGPSQIIDPTTYVWQDSGWEGVSLLGQIIYELHIGTFTREGTWLAAIEHLNRLAELGITVIEVMPVAEFDGEFGWGYDGVDLFAPTRLYGEPDDFRRFVDAAHTHKLGVILDVVYNHFGPSGNYVGQFSDNYFSHRHRTDWGDAINFDGPHSQPVREFFISNAGYWIDEFHLDGLRLDAVHAVYDDSPKKVLGAIGCRVREVAAGRKTIVVVENEFQDTRLLHDLKHSGCGLDGAWNDDFHHSARVAATGCRDYYFGDYRGTPQELISAVKWGHLYQGQWNARQGRNRGGVTWGLEARRFVNFLQNHDQVANSPGGRRLHELTSSGRHRALTALLLLSPGTPMLFQGQEFSASTPFHYFAHHEGELGRLVTEGRKSEMTRFASFVTEAGMPTFFDPCDRRTLAGCVLDHAEFDRHTEAVALHQDLLKLRREDSVFSAQDAERMHGAVLGPEAFVLRFFGKQHDDRLLVVNLGDDLEGHPFTEPLLAPSTIGAWQVIWTSDNLRYGGNGSAAWDPVTGLVPREAALVLAPK